MPRPLQNALDWLRNDLPKRLGKVDRRVALGAGGALLAALLIWLIAGPLTGDDGPEVQTKVVTVSVETDDAAAAPVGPLGFPLVATRNTTRVGGPDPASDAAAIAVATHPRTADAERCRNLPQGIVFNKSANFVSLNIRQSARCSPKIGRAA